jgi:RNA polymerase sigma-70 factor (ECF subfamily)
MELNTQNPHRYAADSEVVMLALNGNMQAFDTIVREYRETVFRVAMRIVKNEEEAEDVTQDAFMNAYRKLDTFKGDSALSSWIYRIAVNTALMRLRKKKRLAEISYEGLQSTDAVDFLWNEADHKVDRGDDIAESKELRGQIAMAIEELEPKYKDVFVAKEVDGLSLQEIADEMDLSIPAVKSRLHRARLSLRVSLERYVEG